MGYILVSNNKVEPTPVLTWKEICVDTRFVKAEVANFVPTTEFQIKLSRNLANNVTGTTKDIF